MQKKQKLELTWIGKENRPRLEPRILLEDPVKSYHAKQRVTEYDIRHFFVLSPNLTIYNKLITDFTPGSPKYVFQGLSDFALEPPENNRRARFYRLTKAGHKLLEAEKRDWEQTAAIIARFFEVKAEDLS